MPALIALLAIALVYPPQAKAVLPALPGGALRGGSSLRIGGSADELLSRIASDSAGNAYVVGTTRSPDLAVARAAQASFGGLIDLFVTKLDPTGSVVCSTYVGGELSESFWDLAFDGQGNAYVIGQTGSASFPTRNAFQPALAGDGASDFFVTKLDGEGAIVYSTYLGSIYSDYEGWHFAVGAAGDLYVSGVVGGPGLPVTRNAFKKKVDYNRVYRTYFDTPFVIHLDPTGAPVFSTYYGGRGGDEAVTHMRVDADGSVIVVGWTYVGKKFPRRNDLHAKPGGQDSFIGKFAADGSLVYSTTFGGSSVDLPLEALLAPSGDLVVVGHTMSPDLLTVNAVQPSSSGPQSLFVLRLDRAGNPRFSTYFGGGGEPPQFQMAALDPDAGVVIGGVTYSSTFPAVHAIQTSGGGGGDAFLARISALGQIVYSSRVGGSAFDLPQSLVARANGGAVLVGSTVSTDLPTLHAFQPTVSRQYNLFIVAVGPDGTASYVTYLGGEAEDELMGIDVDATNAVTVVGSTRGPEFPVFDAFEPIRPGSDDMFVTRLAADGRPVYSTYLGASGDEARYGQGIAASEGRVAIVSVTDSIDFPLRDPIQATPGGSYDFVVVVIEPDGQVARSTYLGGADAELTPAIALAPDGRVLVGGRTASSDFPGFAAVTPPTADVFISILPDDRR
jgi:hypothetical protein